ncbi:ABC transporter ATP-binding protein [Phototrophicus methaneseepsis]|uniref:ABC transporter ATP-binding protein n=1 Tax=Phototrophicus methaneseepsis TaxID=2710758 RepID=A0A7S8EC06_9CHLR|nr:ABC transporter ATP-binding protein [Phototrophicus methaneseepsis]QPC84146.1 ABC transporter ATP-binding protein [Phototrophicus methaneseepsis]
MAEKLLEVKDLKIHFFTDEGVVKAVDGVDINLERGKTLCLVGESGCGKSVTSRAFLKIIHKPGQIVSGEMLYHRPLPNGGYQTVDIAQMDPKGEEIRKIRGKEISMIFQEPMSSLSVLHTVGNQITETILLHEDVSKKEARDRAIELLRLVEIPKPERLIDEYPFRLSGGMRQRVMIAMALSCNPTLLIADEPTTALDVTTQAQILALMKSLQEQYGMALLFITHDLGVVAEIADDVAVMYLGRIIEHTDVDTVFHNPKHPYTQALLESIPKIAVETNDLNPIKGMVPSPFRRPSGCTFHPRCRARFGPCDTVVPSVTHLDENHQVRCLLYENEYARDKVAEIEVESTHG